MAGSVEPFADRLDAGRRLGHALAALAGSDAVVVGLARGGVAVGYATARYLKLPLTVLVVRKVGAPTNPELALGAVSETGVTWLDSEIIASTGASEAYVRREVEHQRSEAQARRDAYRGALPLDIVRGRTAIVVDDGIATGATAMAGLRSARNLGSSTAILATPVASGPAVQMLKREADRIAVLSTPDPFGAVGLYYVEFGQVSDEEVMRYLTAGDKT